MGIIVSYLFYRQYQPFTSVWSSKSFCEETQTSIPTTIHSVIEDSAIGDKHVAIIGDVHGCIEELKQLIGEINQLTHDNCLFIFCGDVINKGPCNKETLDYVRNLKHFALVRGNHEDHVIKNYERMHELQDVKIKYHWIASLSQDDVAFLKELPYTISVPSLNCIVVHAGFNPFISLYHQTPLTMTKVRNVAGIDIGETVYVAEVGHGYPWASFWSGKAHVYFGHDAKRGLQEYEYATGLDTGCVYGKCLTAKLLTGNQELIQVKAKAVYVQPKS